jgi:hypothetical protein
MTRFETEDELSMLSSALGELVTVEVRKRRPEHLVIDSLHVNDVMNVVAGSEGREEPFRHRTNKQGMDLIHDGTNHVRIRMRHQRCQHTMPVIDCCPSATLRRAIARKIPLGADGSETSSDEGMSDDDAPVAVAAEGLATVGMEFTHLGTLHRMQSICINDELVTATACWPRNIAGQVDRFDLIRVEGWLETKAHEELIASGAP